MDKFTVGDKITAEEFNRTCEMKNPLWVDGEPPKDGLVYRVGWKLFGVMEIEGFAFWDEDGWQTVGSFKTVMIPDCWFKEE